MVDQRRIQKLNTAEYTKGDVLYWMDRDRRVKHNWALLRAQEIAEERGVSLLVCYAFPNAFLDSSLRQYDFMIKGLQEVEKDLHKLNIHFIALSGDPKKVIPKCVKESGIGYIVRDFSPLTIIKNWNASIQKKTTIPFEQVDTRNIVPAWEVSDKQEFAAYTIRPKIHKKLGEFLTPFPRVKKQKKSIQRQAIDWKKIYAGLDVRSDITPVNWIKPGEKAARDMLTSFIKKRLPLYAEQRNDPNADAQSNLSPYLHFGQISAQYIAQEIEKNVPPSQNRDDFLEELIVRRELSDNFCLYNNQYDSFNGFPEWAQKTLNEHREDARDYTYSKKQFEDAATHDALWNAAQKEMVETGKMHGYMRMYWAKKILEWTDSPEKAMEIAIYLNDAYELDGRDSNGYAGIAWSIGGVHDRAWGERPVYGKIRYMNSNGAKRKFNVKAYIKKWDK